MVERNFGIESVGVFGLSKASFGIGANLDGIIGAEEEIFYLPIWTHFGKRFGNEVSVIETANMNMLVDGGKRNNFDGTVDEGENVVENFGKRF